MFRGPLIYKGLLILFGCICVAWLFLVPGEPENRFSFHADGNRMAGMELQVRKDMGSYALSALVAIDRGKPAWTAFNPERAVAVCGALLTRAASGAVGLVERDQVYRVEIVANVEGFGSARNRAADVRIPVAVVDGRCVAPAASDRLTLSLPEPLGKWVIAEVESHFKNKTVSVVFEPRDGVTHDDAMLDFDPLIACQAALAETFPSDVTPIPRERFKTVEVVARNSRDFSIFQAYSSEAWTFAIAGRLCTENEGVAG